MRILVKTYTITLEKFYKINYTSISMIKYKCGFALCFKHERSLFKQKSLNNCIKQIWNKCKKNFTILLEADKKSGNHTTFQSWECKGFNIWMSPKVFQFLRKLMFEVSERMTLICTFFFVKKKGIGCTCYIQDRFISGLSSVVSLASVFM